MTTSRPHFIRADFSFTCSECLERFPINSLLMVYRECLAAAPLLMGVRPATKHLCEECGKLLLESY